ncbi:MAG: BTAD domain-containing putative transcriptional regulator [Ornithinibacter sp.]
MRIAVLGPLEVDEGRILLAPRDQVVLEALVARPGESVRAEALAEALWGERLPASWPKVVQGCVSRLRKVLGTSAIVTSGTGYRLAVHRDDVDHLCFEDLLLRASQLLAEEPERAVYASRQALDLWRGDPLERLAEWEVGRIEAERLVERHRDAEDLFAESTIRTGRHGDVLGDLHRMVAQQPTREGRWGLLALAQYQAGRQAEALGTLQRARTTLVNEFGLDPGPALAEIEEAILRQDPALLAKGTLPAEAAVCPYLGLVAYDVVDAPAYFGREADVTACLARLDEVGVLAVVGPSGSGKSSLIRAGVAAALARDGNPVRIVTPGAHPEDVLPQARTGTGAVLVVDQCEEALALSETSPEREEFFAGLVDFAARGRLVISLRADRLGELAAHPDFAHLVESGLYLLGAMGPAQLRSAIDGPAAQAGLRLEPGLVDLLVREAEGSRGALPLLSHVLRQTWRRREGDTLTVEGYAGTGGVREAVAQSAERLYRELTASQQGMLRDLMVRLVSSGDAGEPVRTRVARRTVASDDEHTAVVERLVGARLLSSDGDNLEIAHESLALAWPRLRSWLDDDVEGLRIMRHVTVAAESWDQLGRPDSELYRGLRQARATQWRSLSTPDLTPVEKDFLDASAVLVEAEERAAQEQVERERRTNRRLRASLAAVLAFLVIAVMAGVMEVNAAQREQRAATVADARRLGAEALRGTEIDRSLLLAATATTLDDSSETRTNLTAVLNRAPQLLGAARSGGMLSISLRPDGRIVATGGYLTGVTLFDGGTLREVGRNHDVPVRRIQYSPDGKHLLAAVNPWTPIGVRRVDPLPLRVLDPTTGALGPTQLGGVPTGRVVHDAFGYSANGRWLAAAFIHPTQADIKSAIRVWDTKDLSRPVASFTIPLIVEEIVVNNGGTRLYVTSGSPGEVHSIDLPRHRVLRSVPADWPLRLALTKDGKSLAVTRGAEIALLDPEHLSEQSVLSEEQGIGGDLAISPTGDRIGYAVDGTLVVRALGDPDAAGVRYPTGDRVEPAGIAFTSDDRTAYTARGDGLLLMWDLVGDRQFVRSIGIAPQPDPANNISARVSPDGRTTAYLIDRGDESFAVQFLDLGTGTWTTRSPFLHTPTYYADIAWHPASTIVATVHGDQSARLWDRRSGRLVAEVRVPTEHGVPDGVAFSGDGSRVVVGTDKGWVHTFSTSSGKTVGTPLTVIPGVPAPSFGVNRDGSRTLSSAGGKVQLLDLAAGRTLRSADVGFQINSFAWSPDETAVAVSGNDNKVDLSRRVGLLDPKTLRVRSVTSGEQSAGGWGISYSPDGSQFVTATEGLVSLWDARTARLLGSLRAEHGDGAGFAPGTGNVLSATTDGAILAWDPRPESALKTACRLAGRDLTAEEWAKYLPDRARTPVCAH